MFYLPYKHDIFNSLLAKSTAGGGEGRQPDPRVPVLLCHQLPPADLPLAALGKVGTPDTSIPSTSTSGNGRDLGASVVLGCSWRKPRKPGQHQETGCRQNGYIGKEGFWKRRHETPEGTPNLTLAKSLGVSVGTLGALCQEEVHSAMGALWTPAESKCEFRKPRVGF